MRYRDLDAIDLGAARKAVCAWLDEHQGGTLAQMAEDLKMPVPGTSGRDGGDPARHDGRRAASADPAGERFDWRGAR
jgi:hypothetical protein